ncbi:rhodanese-like domain-containing protein [Azonexus sp.]|uniref:rhodanese-like domain-containing protein n=1 Tax=Azonexus sp. TaxID=1872668 RepID=UPI0039E5C409
MPMEFVNQNILLIGIVVVSGLGLLWPLLFRSVGQAVNPAQATQLINREEALILDVREANEMAAGSLPNAVHIPVAQLDERLGELSAHKEKPLIVCCTSGMRSGRACTTLKKAGFAQLYNLEGGVDAWAAANYPLVKGGKKK